MTPRQLTVRDEAVAWALFAGFGIAALAVLVAVFGWAGTVAAIVITGAGLASVVDP